MQTRNEKILCDINPANQIGIEIGPLASPIVTREMGQIRYVDHTTTEGLRAKYATDSSVDSSKIVDVDYVWGEKNLVELTKNEFPFDYVVASHVIEHVPDLIGWLNEIRAILKPGGILSLAIPDRAQCFDYKRQLTNPADVIEAYLLRRKQPSPRQIFDYHASAVSFRDSWVWAGPIDAEELVCMYSMADALDITTTALTENRYCDVHCWVFTPESFFKLLQNLSTLGLVRFEIAQFYETEGCEFLLSLRATEISEPEKIKDFVEKLTPEISDFETVALDPETDLRLQVKELQKKIQAMESSKFWKIRKMWLQVKRALGY